jgi:transposase InsO family protein
LYLAAMLDIYSRKVVGWVMDKHMQQELVASALRMAITQRRPSDGVLRHTDRGSQYADRDYQQPQPKRDYAGSYISARVAGHGPAREENACLL